VHQDVKPDNILPFPGPSAAATAARFAATTAAMELLRLDLMKLTAERAGPSELTAADAWMPSSASAKQGGNREEGGSCTPGVGVPEHRCIRSGGVPRVSRSGTA
jgi:hypothetical protein